MPEDKTRSATNAAANALLEQRLNAQETEQKYVVSLLEDIKNKLISLEELKQPVQDMQNAITFISDKFDKLVIDMEGIKKENKVLKTEINNLKASGLIQKKKVNDMRMQMEYDYNETRKTNLLIRNVPKVQGENLHDIFIKLAALLKEKNNILDIINIHRIQNTQDKEGLIKVTLKSAEISSALLLSARKNKPSTAKLGLKVSDRPIFINEDVSFFTRTLLAKSIQFKKQFSWKYAWMKNGRVFLKKEESGKAVWITDEEDIQVLAK